MANCPRPGCTGEVVNGNCQLCGIAVETSADEEAERLRRIAEEQASKLREAAESASGTGWFRAVSAGSSGDSGSGGSGGSGGAHRKPDSPSPTSTAGEDAGLAEPVRTSEPVRHAEQPTGRPLRWRASQALPWEQAGEPAADATPPGQTPGDEMAGGRHHSDRERSASQAQPVGEQMSQAQSNQPTQAGQFAQLPPSQPHGFGQAQPSQPGHGQSVQLSQPGQGQPSQQAQHGQQQPSQGQPSQQAQASQQGQPSHGQPSQPAQQSSQGQPSPSQQGQGQPSQGQPSQGQPSQGQASRQGQPGQAQPSQPGQARPARLPSQGQPSPSQPSQPQPSQGQPAQQPRQPGQVQPGQPALGQGQPSQPLPSQGLPSQGQPSQGQPSQPQPGQGRWGEGQPSQGYVGPPSHAQQGHPGQVPPGSGWQQAPRQGQQPGQWNVQPGQSAPGQQGVPLWGQHIPMPAVLPRPPGTKPDTALSDDDPQPTSVLGETPETLSIEPPQAEKEDEGPATALAKPEGTAESPHGTGSSSFPTGRRTSSRASGRGRLGAGLVEVPVVPVRDPASAVLKDPAVSENKRFCSNCGAEVGRGKDGEPGATEGDCASCGTPFNFRPRLFHGDLVGGQYEVLGCLAYGGLGWIYLAKDHNVSDRWVVLKGMIDTGDATSMASAVAERRFLAEVEHPNVVRIYNFVQHPDPKTGNLVGYIVMEYVGGQSLRQLALSHHRDTGRAEPLPIGQVIAYGLEILPAIGYLHSIDMLYCDLKPDNVIQSGEQLKLIDLGAVRKIDDYESPLFFTLGYSAPELAAEGATIASDIYTVGRTLAVLSIEFAGYTTRHKHTLPGPEEEPLFALFGSYHRVLKRATHENPALRFTSADEMADQLTGVLREVMALGTGRPRPGQSAVFAMETRTFGSGMVVGERGSLPSPDPLEVASILPLPMVDTGDHAASTLASITATEAAEVVAALASAPQDSIEVRLRMVRARLELGDLRAAAAELEAARRLVTDPADWRPDWYEGLIAIATRRPADATAAFEKVYDAVPGEIPPKLALAISAEYTGNYFWAARYYELVWRTDRSWVSAAFGLARVYLAQGGRVSAIEVLEAVPDTSSHHVAAQVAAIKIKTRSDVVAAVGEHDLHDAARRLERLALDAERRTTLAAEVLEAAYGWVRAGRPGAAAAGSDGRMVLGCRLAERELRFGLERCYRALARLASTPEQRHELVDKANTIRPRTLT